MLLDQNVGYYTVGSSSSVLAEGCTVEDRLPLEFLIGVVHKSVEERPQLKPTCEHVAIMNMRVRMNRRSGRTCCSPTKPSKTLADILVLQN
jgi:hypothetical protein